MWQTYLVVALVAYLLGSIPFGYILVKLFLKQDIRQTGSGNIGATNVARSGKKGLAIATLLLDAAKGSLAVFVAARVFYALQHSFDLGSFLMTFLSRLPERQLYSPGSIWIVMGVVANPAIVAVCIGALAAICGHVFPVWLGFKGGKGVATALGAFAMISPGAVAISAIVFAMIFVFTKVVSVSSIVSTAVFPVAAIYLRKDFRHVEIASVLISSSLLIILKHHGNIRRLLNGTEPKFTTKKAAVPADPIQVEKNA